MIIIDTNILMELEDVDVFEQLKQFREFGEPAILSVSLSELEKIGTRKARFALRVVNLIKDFDPKLRIIRTYEKDADSAILKFARPVKDAVATNDRELIKALKLNNVKVIRIRQKKHLSLA
jgi:rRNA-processing protein FCF1